VPIHKGRKVVEEQILPRRPRRFECLVSNCSTSGLSESTTNESVRPKITTGMISERRQIVNDSVGR